MSDRTAPLALRMHDVSKRFGTHLAVDGVSLEVMPGEFVTILGPSGSGKSTTLRLIAGLDRQDAGTIALGGVSVDPLPPHRRDCAMVFQNLALFPHRSVRDNVGFGLAIRRARDVDAARRVEALLRLVGLDALGERRPDQLSGGQQQRVALARALAVNPAVLLLDEPLGALDLALRRQLQAELRAIQRKTGRAFLHVTHDQQEALALADRVVVMADGRIAQVGTPVEIWERPTNRFVAEFMGFRNVWPVEGREGDAMRIAGTAIPAPGGMGAARFVAIRPERVRLGPPYRGDALLRGVVSTRTYTGNAWTHEIRLSSGGLLEASGERAWPEGEAVHASLDPAHLVPLAE